jgi:nucleoside-diphosphate-sugar epimerase
LGRVIDCVGLTSDFRTRPMEAVEAHAFRLTGLLPAVDFDLWAYLSSTRLYRRCLSAVDEEQPIVVDPADAEDLYNISKLMGEAVVRASGRPFVIARLSNVYGPGDRSDNFLASIIREAISTGRIVLQTSLESAKDYVSVTAVARALVDLVDLGQPMTVNVASGRNTSNGEIVSALSKLTGCDVDVVPGAETAAFPRVSIDRVSRAVPFRPSDVLHDLHSLVDAVRRSEDVEPRG